MHIIISDDYQDCVRSLTAADTLRAAGHTLEVHADSLTDEDALVARFAKADALVLIRERTKITPTLLDRLPKLKLISQTGKISSHINVADCTARGIAVAEGTGAPTSTAEMTFALILSSMRNIPHEVARLKDGKWQHTLGRVLKGQRLGIWSYGKIGKLVAGYGRAFGMDVWVWGREGSTSAARADGFTVAPSRDAFFAQSDVVCLHVRLNKDTEGMVKPADLARMKKNALIVNTSRAELIEAGALEAALSLGFPGFAAVDVYESEPILGADHPLLKLPNALCTPHLGYVERENYEFYFGTAFDNVVAFAKGAPTNLANKDVVLKA